MHHALLTYSLWFFLFYRHLLIFILVIYKNLFEVFIFKKISNEFLETLMYLQVCFIDREFVCVFFLLCFNFFFPWISAVISEYFLFPYGLFPGIFRWVFLLIFLFIVIFFRIIILSMFSIIPVEFVELIQRHYIPSVQ